MVVSWSCRGHIAAIAIFAPNEMDKLESSLKYVDVTLTGILSFEGSKLPCGEKRKLWDKIKRDPRAKISESRLRREQGQTYSSLLTS